MLVNNSLNYIPTSFCNWGPELGWYLLAYSWLWTWCNA